jgi:N-methylhydantoinase A/oxoprolinase/acetone carboxylase beta subunit
MQSRGGLTSAAVARRRPVRLFLSGPAAGVIGGQAAGRIVGREDLITVDIGGTSCDIALIQRGQPIIRPEGVIDGYAVRVPMVDVNAIGAGGGSIAWLDGAGGLRVGPHSAGADPGPACYGRGGREATVTDASLVLGYIDPHYFAGGSMRLDPVLAEATITEKVARPLGLSVSAAALGIHRVLNAQMAEGIRLVSIRRGCDPRGFALVALGGGGPLHATALARELGIRTIIIPRFPGVLSASGLLCAPTEHEVATSFHRDLAAADPANLQHVLADLDRRCAELMAAEELGPEGYRITHSADICYIGQSHFIEVPLDLAGKAPLETLYRAFLAAHDRLYGHGTALPARIVNLRSVAVAPAKGEIGGGAYAPSGGDAEKGTRNIILHGRAAPVRARIYEREALVVGTVLSGPAIVEQPDTTTLIDVGWRGRVGAGGTLLLETSQEASQ